MAAPTQTQKVRVRFNESIAGQADPTPTLLEERYRRIEKEMAHQGVGPVKIAEHINARRISDSGATPTGFQKDWSFKPGQEAFISAEIAALWQNSGICEILPAASK